MLRDRILIWLFIAATVAVDLTLLSVAESRVFTVLPLAGFVLGQVGVLAIWSGNPGIHRLARAAWLVIATGILAWATGREAFGKTTEWLALLSSYALLVWAMNLLIKLARSRMNRGSLERSSERHWQIPLIEIFGWTVVVAVASFGARYMTFAFLGSGRSVALTIAGISFVPLGVLLLFHGTQASWYRHAAKALCWIGACWLIGAGIDSLRSRGSGVLETVLSVQAAYLVAWATVVSLSGPTSDHAQSDDPVEDSDSASPQTRLRIRSED